MEQRYFEARAMFGGMAPGMGMFDGYRKGGWLSRLSAWKDSATRSSLASGWLMFSFHLNLTCSGENSGRAARTDVLQWDQVGSSGIGRSM
jgi:hypothetical protein